MNKFLITEAEKSAKQGIGNIPGIFIYIGICLFLFLYQFPKEFNGSYAYVSVCLGSASIFLSNLLTGSKTASLLKRYESGGLLNKEGIHLKNAFLKSEIIEIIGILVPSFTFFSFVHKGIFGKYLKKIIKETSKNVPSEYLNDMNTSISID